MRAVKQFLTYVSAGPFQHAVAAAFALGPAPVEALAASLQAKRDRLCEGLRAAGFDVFVPQGTYFATADISPLGGRDGLEFCRALPQRAGVVAIPTQVFYDDVDAGRRIIRFAFCKRDEVIDDAVERLTSMAGG